MIEVEIWKNIEDYRGKYKISNLGRVESHSNTIPSIMGGRLNEDKYLKVSLTFGGKSKKYFVHRLVAKHFIENPLGKLEVNHLDGNKLNNKASNLEWCTRQENIKHSVENNLYSTGIKNGETCKAC